MPKQVLTDVLIDASPELVWSVFTNYPEWASFNSFLKSEHAPGGLEVGEQLEMHFHPPGQKPQTFKPLVVAYERNKQLRWRGKLWGTNAFFVGEHFFSVRSEPGGKTLFIHGEDFSGMLVGWVGGMLKATEQGFIDFNNGLKRTVEAKAAAAKAATAPAPAAAPPVPAEPAQGEA